MRRILFLVLLTLAISGCANVSPRNTSPINNDNGKIDEIRNNQNGVMAEIGKLRQENELTNSKLKEVQQGLLNLNAAISRNENTGVQILQGDGALILVFSLAVVGMVLYWYRDRAVRSEKVAEIMSKEIANFNDPVLNDNILRAAMKVKSEDRVYHMLNKQVKSTN